MNKVDDQALDRVYTALCQALTRAGENNASLVLGRFALLAILKLDDEAETKRLIEAAAQLESAP